MAFRWDLHSRRALRALAIPVVALSLTAGAGLTVASAAAPTPTSSQYWNWNNNNWNWNNSWNRNNMRNWNSNDWDRYSWNQNQWWNSPYSQPSIYSVYQPSYLPVYQPAPTYYPSYSQQSSPVTISISSYGPGWSTGMTQDEIQVVCNQYSVGLQYGTLSDNPNLDQTCGMMPGMTTGTMPSSYNTYPTSGSYPMTAPSVNGSYSSGTYQPNVQPYPQSYPSSNVYPMTAPSVNGTTSGVSVVPNPSVNGTYSSGTYQPNVQPYP